MTWEAVRLTYLFLTVIKLDIVVAHGTFIGSLRLEAYKPTQLPIGSNFHFGASTRTYIIRERPQAGIRPIIDELEKAGEEGEGGLLGLPETETELDVSYYYVVIYTYRTLFYQSRISRNSTQHIIGVYQCWA